MSAGLGVLLVGMITLHAVAAVLWWRDVRWSTPASASPGKAQDRAANVYPEADPGQPTLPDAALSTPRTRCERRLLADLARWRGRSRGGKILPAPAEDGRNERDDPVVGTLSDVVA